MITKINCHTPECQNFGVEYFLDNQTEPVMCGGCGKFYLPIETKNKPVQLIEPISSESLLAEEKAKQVLRETALAKLAGLGLTEEEARAVIGM